MALFVLGSLSKVWLKLENTKRSDAPALFLDEILSFVKQTTCLLGQTNNSISNHQRYKTFSSSCSPQETKSVLKNKIELQQTNDKNCFGKEFSNHLK